MLQQHAKLSDPNYTRDLGDGLILRWSTQRDSEDIGYLNSFVFRNSPQEPLNEMMASLMRDIMNGQHLMMSPGDFALVEDTRRKKHPLVAGTCLWRQTWEYEGIPFVIGRPEIVATDPDYRNRGLVRAIFELIHARSEAEGHLAQGITGIEYFYRQFGYEYALDLDVRRITHFALIPKAQEGMPEPFTLRDAVEEDIPLIQQLYDQHRKQYPVSTRVDEGWWRYQIRSLGKLNVDDYWHILMIIDREDAAQGYVITPRAYWRQNLGIYDLATVLGLNLQVLMPPLLRALQAHAQHVPAGRPGDGPVDTFSFRLGVKHPAYAVLGKELAFEPQLPYAWYVRVPDLPKFIKHIAPALEVRLANSPVAGYSGTLTFNFYRGGLQLEFAQGKLIGAENWRIPAWHPDADASFPPLVFLQLLFGRRSLTELQYAFPDVDAKNEVKLLLDTLFPANPSWAIPLG
jgi:GNAT superfamily N-acetyltransferase